MSEVKLFGFWASPFSKRIELALKLKGVEYEYIEEDLRNKSPLLLKHNPVHKKTPVLVHNGKPIAESLVILEYIDETFGDPSILPKDPYERAMTRFWAKFLDEKFFPAFRRLCWSRGEEKKKAKQEAKELLKFLENELEGKTFFGGDTIGLIDICAIFIAYWLMNMQEMLGLDFPTNDEFPKLCEWSDEFINLSIVKEILPPKDKLIEHNQNHLKGAPLAPL